MRVAIVGGGVSGLAAAHRLAEVADEAGDKPPPYGMHASTALEVTLFEAGARLGGGVWSEAIGDYPVVEHGADMFITDKPWALALCKRVGLEGELCETDARYRRSLVLRAGRAIPVPEGFALMAPAAFWPMAKTPLLGWGAKLRAGAEIFVPRRTGGGDESIAAFVRRRFGRELLDRLVQPLVGGIYTGDPEALSLRATLPRFVDMEREHRSVTLATLRRAKQGASGEGDKGTSGARYGLFLGLRGGMRRLVERVAARLGATRVELGARVTAIARREGGFRIERAGAEPFACDAVIVALPAWAAAKVLRGLSAPLGASLDAIPYASTAVVVSGHRLADVAHPLDAFGLVVPHVEKRRVLAVSFASRKLAGRAPEGAVQMRTFVGGALQPELCEPSEARIEELVLDELRALLGVAGTPDFVRVARHERAMPQYLVGHLDRVADIERHAAALPGLALCGNAYHGVGIPDCVHSGELAAEQVLEMRGTRQPEGKNRAVSA